MRDEDERAEARRTLALLQALRTAIPASLDAKAADGYREHEAALIGRANGQPAAKAARYAPSATDSKQPARCSPAEIARQRAAA